MTQVKGARRKKEESMEIVLYRFFSEKYRRHTREWDRMCGGLVKKTGFSLFVCGFLVDRRVFYCGFGCYI